MTRLADETESEQQAQLALMQRLNRLQMEQSGAAPELEARIKSFELAYRMQSAAPEALAVDSEPQHIKDLYGLDRPECGHMARQCLVARRMVERGVRFVQLYSGGMENNSAGMATATSKAITRSLPARQISGRRSHQRPRTTRAARLDADRLGGRVRSAADFAKGSQSRARSQSACQHGLARWWRRQRGRLARGHGRRRLQSRGRPRGHSRLSRHDFASTRHESREAHVSAQWSPVSADRCEGACD